MLDYLGLPKFQFDFIEVEFYNLSLLVMAIVDLNAMFFSVYYVFSPVRLQASGEILDYFFINIFFDRVLVNND